jgi:hypothetical protein
LRKSEDAESKESARNVLLLFVGGVAEYMEATSLEVKGSD